MAGYEAGSTDGHYLRTYCPFYLLAAAVLTVSGLHSALSKHR